MPADTTRKKSASAHKNSQYFRLFLNWAFNLNRHLFAPLVVLAVGTFSLDAVTYPGFVRKITDIAPSWFLVLLVISYSILIMRKFIFGEKFTGESLLVLRASMLVLPLGMFLLSSLWKLEASYYPNYVFATFHLNLNILQQILNLILFLAVPYLLTHYLMVEPLIYSASKNVKWLQPSLIAPIIFGISLIVLTSVQLDRIFLRLGKDVAAIMKNPTMTFDERRHQQVGEVYNVYKFFNAYTDENSTVAVPPQSEYGTIGNVGYSRYFMYPRYLIHTTDFPVGEVPKVDYYAIMRSTFNQETNSIEIWPRHEIPAEAIYLYDEYTQQVEEIDIDRYSPDNPIFYDKWGIIKVAYPEN